MNSYRIKSFPKINIGLNVYQQKNSTKHQIMSIFCLIDSYCDEIEINEANNNEVIYINEYGAYQVKDDIVLKVLNFLNDYQNIEQKYQIIIKKNIPINAGLGGSSSNAGSVLKFLLDLYQINLQYDDLLYIALNVGSDIPFFVSGFKIALVSNYGDEIYDLSYLSSPKIMLFPFHWSLITKDIYNQFDQTKMNFPKNDYKYIIRNWEKLHELRINNDLFLPAITINREFYNFYQDINEYVGGNVLMTGSGSFLFKIIK